MGMYAVYDENGRITQANRVYDQPNYGRLLSDHAMPYAFNEQLGIVSDEHWYVGGMEELRERPLLPDISISKTIVKAGGVDVCVVRNVPPHAHVTITMNDGTMLWPRVLLDAREFEVPVYTPCTLIVTIDLWPYQDYRFTVEGVA